MMPCTEPVFRSSELNEEAHMLYLHDKTEKYVERASQMASEIIAKNQGTIYEGPVVIREYHYYDEPFFLDPWYSRSPRVVVVSGEPAVVKPCETRTASQKKSDDAGVAMVAAIVGAVAIYFLASSISKLQDASYELSESKSFKKEILENISYDKLDNCEYLIEAMKVAELKEKICSRITRSSSWDIALRASLAATCGFTVGSYFLSPTLMPIGVCGAVMSGFSMLVKAGFDDSENKNDRDARILQDVVAQLPTPSLTAA